MGGSTVAAAAADNETAAVRSMARRKIQMGCMGASVGSRALYGRVVRPADERRQRAGPSSVDRDRCPRVLLATETLEKTNMKMKVLAAVVAAAALPVLAQTSTSAPVEPRQARVEVADPASARATTPKKASPATKARSAKSTRTTKKTARKK